MKILAFSAVSAISAVVAGSALPPLYHDDLHTPDITFGWCGMYNHSATCQSAQLRHGVCYDLRAIEPTLNDNLPDISVSGGQCVMWKDYDCHGKHTARILGEHIYVDHLCAKISWQNEASSIKCCHGAPGDDFCADPGKFPECSK